MICAEATLFIIMGFFINFSRRLWIASELRETRLSGPVGAGSFVSISPDAFVRTELLFSGVIQIDSDTTGWLI